MKMKVLVRWQIVGATAIGFLALSMTLDLVWAQTKTRLSIATGGTGGVYYPLGGGMAALISPSKRCSLPPGWCWSIRVGSKISSVFFSSPWPRCSRSCAADRELLERPSRPNSRPEVNQASEERGENLARAGSSAI